MTGERGEPLARTQPPPAGAGGASEPPTFAGLLARLLASLAEVTGAERLAAWGRGAGGEPLVLAARVEGARLAAPNEAAYAALGALAGPTDLAAGDSAALRALAGEHGFSAAAPLRAKSGDLLAVLLLGSRRDRAGAVRPRTLAALGSAAARHADAAAALRSTEQLGSLDLEVQRLDRLAAVGGLLAEIVHEIRNPLVSIKTFLHLLDEEGGETAEFRGIAIDELRRIERLLDVVMQHARPPAAASGDAIGEIEPALRSVAQLASLRAGSRGITVEVALAGDVPPARIAPDALRQVLLNLALNAVEASGRGAAVRLAASVSAAGVAIDVEDEGPGVPEAMRERLFEPFFSTKARAGGLGLAITRRLVEEAGGVLAIENLAPRGARFRVTLPLAG